MKLKLDIMKEYGLVLEGGGARGAYQIGAWRALREAGVKIKGVSGTSVGALNGALICMGNLEMAEKVWENISYSQVMSVEDEFMETIINRDFKKIGHTELVSRLLHYLAEGGIDVTPLRELIAAHIDENVIRYGDIDFFFQVFSATELKELEIDARGLQDGELADMVLASAYFPVFKKEKMKGRRLIDAGMFNNVPVDSLVKRGYTDIISIRIYGIGHEKTVKLPEGTQLTEIAPRVPLGNILEFDSRKSRRNMKTGYYDALRMLYGLGGKSYYIDTKLGERECLLRFLKAGIPPYREFLEADLPAYASELGLGCEWDYQELYLALLEHSARLLRIQKYKIYTEDELLAEIRAKWERMEEGKQDEFPEFVEFVIQTADENE